MGTPLPPSLKGHRPPIFGPYLLRPNGCMDQDVTWYVGRPRPRRLCVRWGPSPIPLKGGRAPHLLPPPQFSAHFYCGQTAACTKMPLGLELGLGPGDFVLYGDPAPPPPKGHRSPIFDPYLLPPNGCMDQDVTWYEVRPRRRRRCVRWGSRCPFPKRGADPQNFRPTFIVTKRLSVSKITQKVLIGLW